MARRKSDLPSKGSDEVRQKKASKISKVAFEVSDEDLENASGGLDRTLTTPPGGAIKAVTPTTMHCISVGCGKIY